MNKCEQYCRTIKRMCNSGEVILPLPDEYQQVEYIYSSKQCYIQTNISNNTPLEYECEVKSYDKTGGYIFGTKVSQRYFLQLFTGAGKTAIGYGNYVTGGTLTNNVYYKLEGRIQNGIQTLLVDGVQDISATMTSTITAANIIVFGMSSDNSEKFNGEMKYFRFRSNGALVFNGIACYRKSDNRAGLYDTVSGTFFDSPTIVNFGVGPDV